MDRRCRPAAAFAVFAALAGLAALPTIGCATRAFEAGCSREAGSRTREPLMWLARHPEHRGALYLLGSVHFDESRAQPLGGEIERAFALAHELVVEVDLESAAHLAAADELGRRGLLDPPQTLADVISRSTFERLTQYLDERGLAVERVASRKPWYVANLLVVIELQRAGYDAAHGVDRLFIERARDKPIVELESADAQLELLDGLPLETQEAMLSDALARSPDFERATRELLDAWRYGDEQALQQIVFRSVADDADFEPFYERVFFRRNAAMSE
ncbi:MAG TPA: TraB/GumN family protein, partial [Myxococcota bacterium]|nr:TraB/GumN family protein [Myxococcota bacterium]